MSSRNPISINERVAVALERIATALEAQNAADPLTMLSMAIEAEEAPPILRGDPEKPISGNGFTVIYRHPNPDYELVLRKDETAKGGYTAIVEVKHD